MGESVSSGRTGGGIHPACSGDRVESGGDRIVLARAGASLLAAALIAPAWVSSVTVQASTAIVAAASEAAAVPTSIDARDATIELPELMPRAAAAARGFEEGEVGPLSAEPLAGVV